MPVCRVSIQTDLDGRTVDVTACARTPVGALLPAVIDVLGYRAAPDMVHGWRLDRAVGAPLDESLSLTDNDVHDGALLVLTPTHAPRLGPVGGGSGGGSARTVAAEGNPGAESAERLRESACAWVVSVAAAALGWTGAATGAVAHLIVAAFSACVVCGVAAVTRSSAVAWAGCTLCATTGFLAVPSGPGAANVFLAATAVFAAALVMTRLVARASVALTATASCAALVAVTMSVGMFTALPVAAVGAVLATAALGVLGIAPRLSTLAARLGPRCDTESPDVVQARARTGHVTLTGVVVGCAVGSAAGTILVALGGLRAETSQMAGVAFGFVTGLVLLLRARTYVDDSRRVALIVGGLVCTTAAFVIWCAAAADWTVWATLGLTGVGLGMLRRVDPMPFASRSADILDYAALAAVVPLACWVTGVYGLARDWQLA